jgi:hypothetical protein
VLTTVRLEPFDDAQENPDESIDVNGQAQHERFKHLKTESIKALAYYVSRL